jgi:O-antigen/teichoic acid export membrane protein
MMGVTPQPDLMGITEINVPASPRSINERLAQNTLWSLLGSGFSQGSALLTALLVARMLGVAAFGQLALIQTTALLFGTLAEFGFPLTTTKFVSRWRSAEPERAGRLIGSSLRFTALSGVAVGASLVIIDLSFLGILGFSNLSRELRVGCVLLVFEMLNRVQFGALAGVEAFADSAKVNSVKGFLALPCAWIGTSLGGLLGAVSALAVVSAATFFVGHAILRKTCSRRSIRIRYNGTLEREVFGTSISLWVSAVLLTGSTWVVTVLLSRQPSGLVELGLFNAAGNWKTALLFLPNMLFQVTLPMLSHRHAAGDDRACLRIVISSVVSTVSIAGIGALFLWALARPLMSSYGADFSIGARVLSLAAAVAVVNAVYMVGGSVLWALGKPSTMVSIDLMRTVLLIALCYFGFATSAWNLTTAYLYSYSAACVAILLVSHRHLIPRSA